MNTFPAQIKSLEGNLSVTWYFSSPEVGIRCIPAGSFGVSVPKQSCIILAAEILILFKVQWFWALHVFRSVVQVFFVELGHKTLIELLVLAPSSYWFKKMDTALEDFNITKQHQEHKDQKSRRKNSRRKDGEWP